MDSLSFEILDNVFSYFSDPQVASDRSHFENQQDLLSFTQVSKQFNAVARWVASLSSLASPPLYARSVRLLPTSLERQNVRRNRIAG